MSDDIEVPCPVCGMDIVVSIDIDPPAPEIGDYGYGFSGVVQEQECECEITDEHLHDIAKNEFDAMEEMEGEMAVDRYLDSRNAYDY